MQQFIAARQLSGCPIILSQWSRQGGWLATVGIDDGQCLCFCFLFHLPLVGRGSSESVEGGVRMDTWHHIALFLAGVRDQQLKDGMDDIFNAYTSPVPPVRPACHMDAWRKE